MVNGKLLIEKLIAYAKSFLNLDDLDVIYVRNTLLAEFRIDSAYNGDVDLDYVKEMSVPDVFFDEIKDYAVENGISADETQATLFAAYIFGLLTPKPSTVNQTFNYTREKLGAQEACNYLYRISVMNDYVQKTAISRNLGWTYKDKDNVLEITINLSKPEKDNKDIAKLAKATSNTDKYPACALCKENEGYFGNYKHPPRANLRAVSMTLGGEEWMMQYSPYAYFNEHCIVFNKRHTPMRMTGVTITKLLDFVDLFPNYFIGSNSDLPIVGGSILNHEHYQGGRHEMPMHKAKSLYRLTAEKYPDIEVSVIDWYNSAIRMTGYNRNTICELGSSIVENWKKYSDEKVGIVNSETERHNTCTPLARLLPDGKYCLEIILRNNITTDEYPDGVFHAHPEYHNIKKEGIGLIEAVGLYILPGRLKKQIEEMTYVLTGEKDFSYDEITREDPLYVHRDMIKMLKTEHPVISEREEAEKIIKDYINTTCVKILENTAVFKRDEQGTLAFKRFLSSVGIK